MALQEPTRNEQVAVTNSSSMISEARTIPNARKCLVVRNISDASTKIITINMGFNKATNNNGIVLRQNEAFTDSSEAGYQCHQGGITAICVVTGGVLSIYER